MKQNILILSLMLKLHKRAQSLQLVCINTSDDTFVLQECDRTSCQEVEGSVGA